MKPMLSSSFTAIFMFTTNGPRGVITCRGVSPEVTLGSYPFQVEKSSRTSVHDSTNQSLFPENEGKFGGNQMPDGSIRLSPLRPRRRMICPSISKRAFARDSHDFALFKHFQGFSARYCHSNHSQDHGQWQVCMWCVRVWLCTVYVACCVVLYL